MAQTKRLTTRLRPAERRLALVVAVLLGCWAFLSWLVQPMWERVHTLEATVEAKTEKLEAFNRLIAQAPELERERQQYAAYLAEGPGSQGSFLEAVEALSRRTTVEVGLKPRAERQEDLVTRGEVELDAQGSQEHLLAFLDALLQMPRLLTVQRLRISAAPGGAALLRANLVVETLAFRSPK